MALKELKRVNYRSYLFFTIGVEREQGHGAVGGAVPRPGRHASAVGRLVVEGQTHHLGAQLTQVALHLLLPGLLDVVLGGVLQVGLDLEERGR